MPSVEQRNPALRSSISVRHRVDAICERTIQGIVLLILLWGPLALGSVTEGAFVVIQGLTVLALALWGARLFIQRPFRLFWPPICWAVVAFVLYLIARCQMADMEYPARQLEVKVIVYAALFFLVLHNFGRRESATIAGATLIVLGLALSGLAIFQWATHYPKIWGELKPQGYIARGSGTYINPDNLAGFLEMIVPLGLAYALMGRFSPTIKVLFGYCALAMMAGIGVSVSRGAVLATSISLFAFCILLLYHRDYWRQGLIALVFLLALGILFARQFQPIQWRYVHSFYGGERLYDARFFYWDGGLQIFRLHPLWGAGPAHFTFEFPRYRPIWCQSMVTYAHNDYLNTLCELGIAGLSIILLTCLLLYLGVFKTWPFVRKTGNELARAQSTRAAFVYGASFGLLALLLHSAVDFDMQIPGTAVAAITLMALLTAHLRFATERYWSNPERIGKVLLFGLLCSAAGWLSFQAIRSAKEAYWMDRVYRLDRTAKGAWETQLFALKKAWESEPANFYTAYLLGEHFFALTWNGDSDYRAQAMEAMNWYRKAMTLNPYYAYIPLHYGMCLDWLGKSAEATPYFERANALDPSSYYIALYYGWHKMYLQDYEAARHWFQRSYSIYPEDPSHLAQSYLEALNRRLASPPPQLKLK